MDKLKVYVAGKISPSSVFGTPHWRDGFCQELSEKSGIRLENLDPTKDDAEFPSDESDPKQVFGRNAAMIKSADLVIVNLTDDISVGGSQEMLIAKYFMKPLLAIAKKGGKFNKEEKEIFGKKYAHWKEPFVVVPSDAVVENIDEAAEFIKLFFSHAGKRISKEIAFIDDAVEHYEKKRMK